MNKLGVYEYIKKFDLKEEEINFLISQHDVLKAAIDQNPIAITKEDTTKIMQNIFKQGV